MPIREGDFLGIQKCESCGYQFRWKEIQKAIRWSYKPLVCRKCGTEHRVTIRTRLLVGLLASLIIAFLIKVSYELGLALSLPLIIILLFPYFAQYKANIKNKN